MASVQSDVKMVISAQQTASTAILAVADAIKVLTGAQQEVGAGSAKTSSALDNLRAVAEKLSGVYKTLDQSATRSIQNFEAQNAALESSKEKLASVTQQLEAASGIITKMEKPFASMAQGTANFTERLNAARTAYKTLTTESASLTAQIAKQETALSSAINPVQKISSAANAMEAALKTANSTIAQTTQQQKLLAEGSASANQAMHVMALEAVEALEKEAAAAKMATVETQRLVPVGLRPIAPAATQAAQAVGGLGGALRSFLTTLTTVPGAEERATAAMANFSNAGRTSLSMMQRLRAELTSLVQMYVGFYAVIGGIGKVLEANTALQSAENKLGVVFNQNTQQIAAELDFLRAQSIRLGLSFTDLADQYSTFAVAAQSAGLSLENTRKLFLSIADASRVLHLSTDQLNKVMYAFQEMLTKGQVQSVQLQRMLGTTLTGSVRIFADALGVSTEELTKMMKAGQVFADADLMSKVADKLNAKYGKQLPEALKTTQSEMGRFSALMQQQAIGFGKGGFLNEFTDGLRKLNTYLQTQDATQFFANLGHAVGEVVGLLPVLANNANLIGLAFKGWLAIKIDVWLLGLYTASVQMVGGLTAARTSVISWTVGVQMMAATASGPARAALVGLGATMVGLQGIMIRVTTVVRGLWAAIGGWPGLIFTAAAFVLTSFLGKWLTGAQDANDALERHRNILDKVKEAYIDVANKVDTWANKLKDLSAAQIAANTIQLQNSLASVRQNVPVDPTAANGDPAYEQLSEIADRFRNAKTSAAEFKAELDGFFKKHPDYVQLIADLTDTANKAGDLEKGIQRNSAALSLMAGTATDAQKALLGLAPQPDGWVAGGQVIDEFTTKLEKMQKMVPGLKDQLKLAADIADAKKDYDSAIAGRMIDPDLMAKAQKTYDQVVAYLRNKAAVDAASYYPKDESAIIERIIYVESRGNPTAKNPNSSAAGLGQITDATWRSLVDMLRPEYATRDPSYKDALRENQAFVKQALELLTKMNQEQLADAHIPTTDANTYLAHFLGAGTAIKMILANPDELASKIASKSAVVANKSILGGGATAGDVRAWAAKMMGGGSPIIPSTGETEQEKLNAEIQESIQGYKDETKAIQDSVVVSGRALYIAEQLVAAKKKAGEHSVVTDAEIAEITKYAGALYDAKHAAEDAKKSIQDAVSINDQRVTAIQDLQNSFKDGSSEDAVDALQKKVADLTLQLTKAYAAAQLAMGSLSGPDADKARAELDKVVQSVNILKTGLTDAKQINSLIADTFVQSWSNFVGALQQGGSKLVAIRNLFLSFASSFVEQIDEMIVKQTALNLLSKTNIGSWISGKVNDVTETGGSEALSAAGTTLNIAGEALTKAAFALNGAAATLASSSTIGSLGGLFNSSPDAATDVLSMITEFWHTGGIAGSPGGMKRAVNPLLFAGAKRFHQGGLPGLRANEIPTILERGEEVLRRDNPRHILNGGVGGNPNVSVPVKIVNLLDTDDLISRSLGGAVGTKTLLNVIRSNAVAVRMALS